MENIDKIILEQEYQRQRKIVLDRKKIVRQAEKFADKVEKLLDMKASSERLDT